jgi:protein-S-isoprenylcysteine O-methyltransferase
MITTFLALLLLFIFVIFEGRLRQGAAASSISAGENDRRSTRLLGLAYFVCFMLIFASFLLDALNIASLPAWIGWPGLALAVAGVALRTWSNRVLGAFYTRTLKIAEGQTVVRAGPYAVVRHPGYLGMILTWIGAAMATDNGLVILGVTITIVAVYAYRIASEEKMLLASLDGYAEYRAKTWKLIPFIF